MQERQQNGMEKKFERDGVVIVKATVVQSLRVPHTTRSVLISLGRLPGMIILQLGPKH